MLRYFHSERPAKLLYLLQRRGTSSRRALNNGGVWGADLQRLRNLKELRVRTSAALVSKPGHLQAEAKLLSSWFTAHPWLMKRVEIARVTLWYSTNELDNGVVSYWSVKDDSWTRDNVVVSPDIFDVVF